MLEATTLVALAFFKALMPYLTLFLPFSLPNPPLHIFFCLAKVEILIIPSFDFLNQTCPNLKVLNDPQTSKGILRYPGIFFA